MLEREYHIVLDFDGTVVKHRYPAVGEDIGAVPVLKRLVKNGHKLLLNTMRGRNSKGVDTLQPAIDWFALRGIPLYGVNENPSQKEWTSSPKVYGNIYIDDSTLGAPLKADTNPTSESFASSPYIDWGVVSIYLFYLGLLTREDVVELVQLGTISEELLTANNI